MLTMSELFKMANEIRTVAKLIQKEAADIKLKSKDDEDTIKTHRFSETSNIENFLDFLTRLENKKINNIFPAMKLLNFFSYLLFDPNRQSVPPMTLKNIVSSMLQSQLEEMQTESKKQAERNKTKEKITPALYTKNAIMQKIRRLQKLEDNDKSKNKFKKFIKFILVKEILNYGANNNVNLFIRLLTKIQNFKQFSGRVFDNYKL